MNTSYLCLINSREIKYSINGSAINLQDVDRIKQVISQLSQWDALILIAKKDTAWLALIYWLPMLWKPEAVLKGSSLTIVSSQSTSSSPSWIKTKFNFWNNLYFKTPQTGNKPINWNLKYLLGTLKFWIITRINFLLWEGQNNSISLAPLISPLADNLC